MKNKYLLLLIISVFLLSFVSCKAKEPQQITVFSDGSSSYSVITPERASEDEATLAKSLFDLSDESLGMDTDISDENSREILIGQTNRPETADIVEKLREVYTASAFHYAIAERNGKIVILSDTDVGYVYALEYIKNQYITEGTFSILEDICVINEVLWDAYYASELYYNRTLAAADKDRLEQEKDQLTGELNKYENNNGGSAMTVEQAIEHYKNLAASFDTDDFGEYTYTDFTSKNSYRAPTVRPEKGAHPRILFTASDKEQLKENLSAPQNASTYKLYIALSDTPWDGKFVKLTGSESYLSNYNGDYAARLEAKAFRYAMTGEKIYGYEAIYAAKNAMLTIDTRDSVPDGCRTYGHLMYVVACVYDWCYDLLTEKDKTELVNGCVNLLGKKFEMVYRISGGASNKAPIGQSTMYDHGAEDQILVDYLAFAIACSDEAPEIYELVGGRVLNDYVEAQNYLSQSGNFWEGTMYGSVRGVPTMVSNILIYKMSGLAPFKNLEEAITTTTYYIRPDGQPYRMGDLNENRKIEDFQWMWMANNCFYAGNFYKNNYLKSMAYEYLKGFTSFTNVVAGLSPIQFLCINDPEISVVYDYENNPLPLVRSVTYPGTSIFAKSENDNKNALGIYMTMRENHTASHDHADTGSFQISYNGAALAIDTGAYTSWGNAHHFGYTMQTVAANSVLVYNQNLHGTSTTPGYETGNANMVYSGGQSMAGADLPFTLDDLLQFELLGQTQSLGTKSVERDGKLVYSYLAGDMTGAYDKETVDEVSRYMISVATGNEACPYIFLTFDRITSDEERFHKASLIHTKYEPTLTSDGYAIVTNGDGKLVVQSVGYNTDYVKWGGEGKEFWIPGLDENGNYSLEDGYNLPHNLKIAEDSMDEFGWGRIEISPETAAKTNYMLTVMYVTDATNNTLTPAKDLCSDKLAGTEIFGKAVFFPKEDKLIDSKVTFTLETADTCYVTGVKDGTWEIKKDGAVVDTVTVEGGRIIPVELNGTVLKNNYVGGEHIITFAAGAGEYTLTPVSLAN